eukprot:465439-Hanusia_phi.AAC.1
MKQLCRKLGVSRWPYTRPCIKQLHRGEGDSYQGNLKSEALHSDENNALGGYLISEVDSSDDSNLNDEISQEMDQTVFGLDSLFCEECDIDAFIEEADVWRS